VTGEKIRFYELQMVKSKKYRRRASLCRRDGQYFLAE